MAASNLAQILKDLRRGTMFAPQLAQPRDTTITTVEVYLLNTAAAALAAVDSRPPLRCDYHLAWKGEITSGPTTQETLERAFATFQWGGGTGEPPQRWRDRSLMVGDRITLDSRETWEVGVVGFTRVELHASTAHACVDCRIGPADRPDGRCAGCQERHDELRDDARVEDLVA
jgi:hypothetical protein